MFQLYWLVKRNFLLFFKDPRKIFTTFISPIITVFCFILFGKYMFTQQVANAPISDLEKSQFVDASMLTGLLSLSTITTALSLSVFIVQDAEKKIFNDLAISPIKPSLIRFSYLIVNILLNVLICIVLYLLFILYMVINKTIGLFTVISAFNVFGIVVLGAVLNSAIFTFVFSFVKSVAIYSALIGMISSMSGFFIGAFVPLNVFPTGLRNVLSVLPGTQITNLIRYYALSGIPSMQNIQSYYAIALVGKVIEPWISFIYVSSFAIASIAFSYIFKFNAKKSR
ncbi:ABC transporter permease [Mycoplasma sp. 1458C]|uniref:ABC transporter permease n=1 Tax=Mycoplasma sp. 1458C TaxID=3401661 RepID=UPI003AADAB6D